MTGGTRAFGLARPLGDLAVAALAFGAALWLRVHLPIPFTGGRLPADRLALFARDWPAVLAVQALLLYFFGFYDPPQPLPRIELGRRLLSAAGTQGLALVGWFFLADRGFPRSVLLLYTLLDGVLLLGWRLTLQAVYRVPERRVVLVGTGPAAREVAASIVERRWHGLRVAGHVPVPGEPSTPAGDGDAVLLGPRLGNLESLAGLLRDGIADDVILASEPASWRTDLMDRLAGARPVGSSVLLLPGPFESLIGRMRYRWVHDIPLIEVMRETEWRLNRPLKRALDLVAGLLLAAFALLPMAACALFIRLRAGAPVLYRQQRVGRGRRIFTVYKFRTMRPDAEAEGEVLAQPQDPRLVPGGATLRRLRLDELPQLWNVLTGSMSLVGPRPERPGFVDRYQREVPGYAERFAVPPGLTGLAQVNGDYHSSAANKLRYDLAYIANGSLWLDLSILFRTVKIVLTSRGV